MLTRRVVARLDVKPSLGVVKGVRYEGLHVVGEPRAMACRYADQGADEILALDVTATLYGRSVDLPLIRALNAELTVPLAYGGGVRSVADVRACLRAGAEKVCLNSEAVARPTLITDAARAFGSQAIVLQLDIKRRGARWEAYTHGGRERAERDALEWACEAVERGAGEVLVTSVDRDGTRQGLDHEFLQALRPKVQVPLVLSGGARDAGDVVAAYQAGASGVALGAWLHGGGSVWEVKAAMQSTGVEVRL